MLETSRLGFGTASLHQTLRASDRQAQLRAAFDAGISHFDSARMYGEGMAEGELGRFFSGGLRREVTLATKFGLPAVPLFERFPSLMYAQRYFDGVAQRAGWSTHSVRVRALSLAMAESSLAKSMKALRTDWLDILFVHEPQISDIPHLHDLVDWLTRQRSMGRVRYLGLAGNAANCVAVMKQVEGVFNVLQVEDSLAECEADVVKQAGWPMQMTYGYLRREYGNRSKFSSPPIDGLAVIKSALVRNAHGMVLVSSRKVERIRGLAALAE